jgi:plastocyanin
MLLAVVLGVAGCGGSDSESQDAGTNTTSSTVSVNTTSSPDAIIEMPIQGFAFGSSELRIRAGQTVRWVNRDSMDHTVTSGKNRTSDGAFDQNLAPGESFEYKFSSAGTFDYFCRPHANMNAKIIVL